MWREAGAFHQRNGDRSVDHDVGDRAARDGAKQARREHRHLARAAGRVAGECHGKVHEQLPGAGALHECTEQDEDQHIGCRHRERDAENSLGGHIELIHEPHRLKLRDKEAVQHEQNRGERQRPADHAARSLQHDHAHDRTHDHIGRRQVVDIEDAVDDVFVIDEQMQYRREAKHEQNVVEHCRGIARRTRSTVDQKQQHQRERQMRTAIEHRFRRAEGDRPYMIERHRDADGRHRQADDAGVTQIELQGIWHAPSARGC